jgi:hypothetical protein
MKTNILILAIIFFTTISCNNNNDNNKKENYNMQTSIVLNLKNSAGETLFNTENYNPENFKIYYEINGQKLEFYMPNYDNPRGFSMGYDQDPILMGMVLNTINEQVLPSTTYIEWNENETDTITATFLKGDGYFIVNKVWVNGELKPFEVIDNLSDRVITIVK